MKIFTAALILIVAIIVLAVGITKFNGLSSRDENVVKAWRPLEAVLKERYDSIPRLVPAVELYVGHAVPEMALLAKLIPQFNSAETIADRARAANGIEDALQKFGQAIADRYQGILSNNQIDTIVNRINATTQGITGPATTFNEASQIYNAYRRNFPANIVAAMFGFAPEYVYIEPQK